MWLRVEKPIGIEILNPNIKDKNGEFYRNYGLRRINLPVGIYDIHGKYKVIPFINYALPKLPMREKIYAVPKMKDIVIEFVDNLPYKAQIDIHRRLIQINSRMKKASTAEFTCVFMHELGHFLYSTEYKCDIYAIREMLKMGFNPSQFKAFLSILTKHPERVEIALRTAKLSDRERNANSSSFGNWVSNLFASK